ncbi:MAG: hypothetical protein IIX72_00565 [Oscillospiraceae bacterium]|nr:hypothetical protein [Oscillospiraceae bacterium]
MRKEDMHVIGDLVAFANARKYSKQKIADAMHKDVTVVKKQLTETRGNLTLNTAYEYAEALGGVVCFMSDEEYAAYSQLDELRFKIKELEKHEKLLQKYTELNEKFMRQQEMIDRLLAKIDIKDEAIMRKDRRIDELAKKLGMWE